MQRRKILKFDIKNNQLRVDMYKAESIRIEGRCIIDLPPKLTKANTRVYLDNLLLKLDSEFSIGFKKNGKKEIDAWIINNVFKIYIREDIDELIYNAILKKVKDGTIIIKD